MRSLYSRIGPLSLVGLFIFALQACPAGARNCNSSLVRKEGKCSKTIWEGIRIQMAGGKHRLRAGPAACRVDVACPALPPASRLRC